MRTFFPLIASTLSAVACSALLLASCDYQLPRVDPTLEDDGSGGEGGWGTASSSSSNGGFGGTITSGEGSGVSSSSSSSSGTPIITCGNGMLDPGEGCDDGNVRGGDGCNTTCGTEDHDGCAGNVLFLGKETVVISNTTANATDDITRSATVQACGAGDRFGPDLIYTVAAVYNGTLTATLEAKYNNHFLHIRTACPGGDENEVACDYGTTTSKLDSSTLVVNAGALLYVIVDGHVNDSGPFTLSLTLQ